MKDLLASKKWRTLVGGVVVTLALRLGLPEEHAAAAADLVLKLVAAYLLAQGGADLGKYLGLGSAELHAAKSDPASTPPTDGAPKNP